MKLQKIIQISLASLFLSGCLSMGSKKLDPILSSGLRPYIPEKYEEFQNHALVGYESDYQECLEYPKKVEYTFYSLIYQSGNYKIKALVGLPAQFNPKEKHPLVVFNRGGNRDFGYLTVCEIGLLSQFAKTVPNAVVVASQYRGSYGSEGRDEFGGADVDDILSLVKWTEGVSFIDSKDRYLVGWSRGGLMTYLTLKRDKTFKAAVAIAAPADLIPSEKSRPEMADVYKTLIPGYEKNRIKVLKERSAVYWPEKINTPLLILHGDSDWRVSVEDSRRMDKAMARLKKSYKYVEFANEGHDLNGVYQQVLQNTRDWFASHK